MRPYTQILRFLATGALNTAIGLGIIFGLMKLGAGYAMANFCGYSVAVSVSFLLNRRWTFNATGRIDQALLRFFLVVLVSYLLNLGVLTVSVEIFDVDNVVAQCLSLFAYTIFFFFGTKYFAFKSTRS